MRSTIQSLISLTFVPPLLALNGCSAGHRDPLTHEQHFSADAGDAGFTEEFMLLPEYEPAAEEPGSSAVANDDPRIIGWATDYVHPFTFGTDVDESWRDPQRALGPAEGTTDAVTSLGNGGMIEVVFSAPIVDGDGPDLAVFENSFSDDFLELGYVEVSSNGVAFLRFDSAYLRAEPVAQYGTQDTRQIGGLAGKYRAGFGTPFDLTSLASKDQARDGSVDLNHITHVRVVDIIGDGEALDSFGQPIYDPTPSVGTAGFDLDGIAVLRSLHQ